MVVEEGPQGKDDMPPLSGSSDDNGAAVAVAAAAVESTPPLSGDPSGTPRVKSGEPAKNDDGSNEGGVVGTAACLACSSIDGDRVLRLLSSRPPAGGLPALPSRARADNGTLAKDRLGRQRHEAGGIQEKGEGALENTGTGGHKEDGGRGGKQGGQAAAAAAAGGAKVTRSSDPTPEEAKAWELAVGAMAESRRQRVKTASCVAGGSVISAGAVSGAGAVSDAAIGAAGSGGFSLPSPATLLFAGGSPALVDGGVGRVEKDITHGANASAHATTVGAEKVVTVVDGNGANRAAADLMDVSDRGECDGSPMATTVKATTTTRRRLGGMMDGVEETERKVGIFFCFSPHFSYVVLFSPPLPPLSPPPYEPIASKGATGHYGTPVPTLLLVFEY